MEKVIVLRLIKLMEINDLMGLKTASQLNELIQELKLLEEENIVYITKKEKPQMIGGLINTGNSITGAEYIGGKFVSGIESIFKGAENLIVGGYYQLMGNTYAAQKLYAENDPQALSKKLDQQYKANGFKLEHLGDYDLKLETKPE